MQLAVCSVLFSFGVHSLSHYGFNIYFLLLSEDDIHKPGDVFGKERCQSQTMLLFCFVIFISRGTSKI